MQKPSQKIASPNTSARSAMSQRVEHLLSGTSSHLFKAAPPAVPAVNHAFYS
jgi:hypothetical protein